MHCRLADAGFFFGFGFIGSVNQYLLLSWLRHKVDLAAVQRYYSLLLTAPCRCRLLLLTSSFFEAWSNFLEELPLVLGVYAYSSVDDAAYVLGTLALADGDFKVAARRLAHGLLFHGDACRDAALYLESFAHLGRGAVLDKVGLRALRSRNAQCPLPQL